MGIIIFKIQEEHPSHPTAAGRLQTLQTLENL